MSAKDGDNGGAAAGAALSVPAARPRRVVAANGVAAAAAAAADATSESSSARRTEGKGTAVDSDYLPQDRRQRVPASTPRGRGRKRPVDTVDDGDDGPPKLAAAAAAAAPAPAAGRRKSAKGAGKISGKRWKAADIKRKARTPRPPPRGRGRLTPLPPARVCRGVRHHCAGEARRARTMGVGVDALQRAASQ